MNVFEIALDVDKRDNKECVYLRQGDVNGTTIRASVRDHGKPIEGSGYTANFCMTLPDRKTYYLTEATYNSGTITVVVDESVAAAVPGATNNAYFEIYDGSELKYTTASFLVRIKPSAMDGKQTAHSYDSRIEELMDELNEALEECVAPTVTVEEGEGEYTVTITTPSGDSTFTVHDGEKGEKGDKGDKGDTGDATLPNSVGMTQLTEDVRRRLTATGITGTLGSSNPSATDAFPAELVSLTFYGTTTQSGVPTFDTPVPIVGIDSMSLDADGDDWPIVFGFWGYELRDLGNDARDELVVSPDGRVTLVQKTASVDLGTLTWARTETKTGGLARYYTNSLNGSIFPASSNSVVGRIMSDSFASTSYSSTYNRVDDSIGVSTAGTVAAYLERYAGNTHTASEFKAAVSGKKLVYVLAHPINHDMGTMELPVVPAPNVTFASVDPFSVTYERDLQIVIDRLESAVAGII